MREGLTAAEKGSPDARGEAAAADATGQGLVDHGQRFHSRVKETSQKGQEKLKTDGAEPREVAITESSEQRGHRQVLQTHVCQAPRQVLSTLRLVEPSGQF